MKIKYWMKSFSLAHSKTEAWWIIVKKNVELKNVKWVFYGPGRKYETRLAYIEFFAFQASDDEMNEECVHVQSKWFVNKILCLLQNSLVYVQRLVIFLTTHKMVNENSDWQYDSSFQNKKLIILYQDSCIKNK